MILTGIQSLAHPGLYMPQQHIYMQLADPWTTPDFTDITPLVKQWSGTVRGRQHELQLFQPGQVAITLEGNLNQGRFNPWNKNSVYYNLLSPDDAAQLTSNGTWQASLNCGLQAYGAAPPVPLDNGTALFMIGTGASPSTIITNYYTVVEGQYYSAMCSFLSTALLTERTVFVNINWYNNLSQLISTAIQPFGPADNPTSWTKSSLIGVQAPSGAIGAAVTATVVAMPESEGHWVGRAALFNYSPNVPNTAWGPGQRGLVPGRPMYCTATWPLPTATVPGVTYPVWYAYISNLTPAYGQVKSEMVINCSDGLALLNLGDCSSQAYANLVLADGASMFWRLGDPPGSTQAASTGSNPIFNLLAYYVEFGQQSPLLLDDTTVASFAGTNSTGSLVSQINVPSTIGSLELAFAMPAQTAQTLLFGTINNGFITFDPTNNNFGVHASSADGIAAAVDIVAPQCDDGAWHHLIVTWGFTTGEGNETMSVYLDGLLVGTEGGVYTSMFLPSDEFNDFTTFTFGSQVFNGALYTFNGSMGDIAYYVGTELTAAQVTNHYDTWSAGFQVQYSGQRIAQILENVGWPSWLTASNLATQGISLIQAATSSLTQTSALSYLQTVESTELGALFINPSGVITFLDRHYVITSMAATVSNATFANLDIPNVYHYMPGLVPAMDDTDLWNDVPAQANGGVLQRTTNALSVLQYGKRSLTGYTGELQTNDAEVLAQSQWLCAQYSTPYTRVRSLTLSSRTDQGANLPQMLGRGILDRITLLWNPIDGSTFYYDEDSLVESIQHTVTMQEWITQWGLEPAHNNTYMILNDPVFGQLSTNNQLGY